MQTVTAYTLAELQAQHPQAFERVRKQWEEFAYSVEVPWAQESVDSLRAACEAFGGELERWDISPHSMPTASVWIDSDRERDQLLVRETLERLGYWPKDSDAPTFPGLCKLTGYCLDDDILEHVYRETLQGDTLSGSLESAAYIVMRAMEGNLEQWLDDESMLANWGERLYTEDGLLVRK